MGGGEGGGRVVGGGEGERARACAENEELRQNPKGFQDRHPKTIRMLKVREMELAIYLKGNLFNEPSKIIRSTRAEPGLKMEMKHEKQGGGKRGEERRRKRSRSGRRRMTSWRGSKWWQRN